MKFGRPNPWPFAHNSGHNRLQRLAALNRRRLGEVAYFDEVVGTEGERSIIKLSKGVITAHIAQKINAVA